VVAQQFPASHAAFDAAARGLFYSLPVAFDPAESIGPYLAVIDRDHAGKPYRFLDMGALIATQAFGENEPAVVSAVLESLPFVTSRYAHSEYQTVLSLRLKAALSRVAPAGAPRFFVCNTGAEAVENAIKAVLLNRVKTGDTPTAASSSRSKARFTGARSAASPSRIARRRDLAFQPSTGRTFVSGRRARIPQRNRAARRTQFETTVGLARFWTAAPRRQEQRHLPPRDGRPRRFPGSP
jgi:hypothetical protein